MDKELYYEIGENEYWIKDKNDPLFVVHQYEPYTKLYAPNGTLEENAVAQMEELKKMMEPVDPSTDPIYQQGYDQAVLDLMEQGVI